MTVFFAIEPFRLRLEKLLDVKRRVYAGIVEEISDAFRNVPIEQIRNNRDMILLEDPLIVVKLRLPDKKHKLSKKDGFRLIYLAYKNTEKVVFLDIYPKRGPLQQLDLSDSDLLDLLDRYNMEMEEQSLQRYSV